MSAGKPATSGYGREWPLFGGFAGVTVPAGHRARTRALRRALRFSGINRVVSDTWVLTANSMTGATGSFPSGRTGHRLFELGFTGHHPKADVRLAAGGRLPWIMTLLSS